MSPYRRRPLVWRSGHEGHAFVHERTVSVQQTGWTFLAISRPSMPPPLRALLWWAPDDSGTAVRHEAVSTPLFPLPL